MQLLIMAAGLGSRYGGLKQITPMGPNGEFIIDYSVYDAVKAGFSKVVFIIKEENYEEFKETIGKRVEKYIDVEYAFQKMEEIPDFVNIPKQRVKPWGTGQAIYCAKDKITEPFAIINADDFYGRDAFMVAKKFLESDTKSKYSIVSYKAKNTMTENGSVKRAVITSENGLLKSLVECKLEWVNGKIQATPLDSNDSFIIEDDAPVSMNLLTFDLSIFDYLQEKMTEFFKKNENNLETVEFLIPTVLDEINNEGVEVKVLTTDASWYGVTYKEDTQGVQNAIKNLISQNEYPNDLWRE